MTIRNVSVDRKVNFVGGGLRIYVNWWATLYLRCMQDVNPIVACMQLGMNYSGSKY